MKLFTRFIISLLVGLCGFSAHAQVNGGLQSFSFLTMPVSPRLTAMGGQLVSVQDEDFTLANSNPALLNSKGHQQLAFHHNFHFAGTGNGYFGYAYHKSSWATSFHGGVNYMRYGDIPWTNEFNQQLGTFSPSEFSVVVGASRQWQERLSYGMNVRFIQSVLEAYRSVALGADLGVYYENPESLFGIGMVLQHMGVQLQQFHEGQRENLPFNALIGVSKRLKYLPFRLSVTAHSLHRWDLRYDDPARRTTTFFPGQSPEKDNTFSQSVDNVFRHLTFSGEFLLGKTESFRIRLGYDHLQRREMLVPNYRGLAGFSGGLGLRIYRFRVDYGFGIYHLAGAAHHLGIGTNLKEFFPGI